MSDGEVEAGAKRSRTGGASSGVDLTIHGLIDRLSERYSAGEHKLEAMRARFQVAERRKTLGFSPGDLFEARVVWDGDAPVFGRTFLFHPPDAREVVLDWVEKAVERGVARDEILFHLSRNHIRWHRLGHTGAAKIYRDNG